MQGVETSHLNATIDAVLSGYYALMDSTVAEALKPVLAYGKGDTLGLDAMPEITIVDKLCDYDRYAIIITEECGLKEEQLVELNDPQRFRTIYLADPTDRSNQFKELLLGVLADDRTRTVAEIASDTKTRKQWEEKNGAPASITGSTSAITCLRRGIPIFAVIANYITQQLYVSCSAGNYLLDLPKKMTHIDLSHVQKSGQRIFFRGLNLTDGDTMRRFVTFMGDGSKKKGYKENFEDSQLMTSEEQTRYLHYAQPGGPSRALYLSDLQPLEVPIGFVLANGEKIGEWIHWLPFVMFAKKLDDESKPALQIFEIFQDRPWAKEGILMSTPPSYSIFRSIKDGSKEVVIDVTRFAYFPNPSKIRSTLLITPYGNAWASRVVNQYGYRPIKLFYQ
ncbi:MAG: hypothetical protein Q7S86_05390 [bacterium]|nr:hypothetical protein [bacterium]